MIDLRAFFRLRRLTFVEKHHEDGDLYTFSFKPSKPPVHTAGQHGLLFNPKLNVRVFSLASAPEEPYVMIGTHIGSKSRYKNALMALRPGDKLTMLGPILNFTLPKNNVNVVFLAQGIGITPFRSMLIHKKKQNIKTRVTLVHVANEPHTYRNITEDAADAAFYPTTPEDFTQTVKTVAQTEQIDTMYYLSGSPRFNRATKKTLLSLGIRRRSIKKDGFLGY